jgi:hypothetical protein
MFVVLLNREPFVEIGKHTKSLSQGPGLLSGSDMELRFGLRHVRGWTRFKMSRSAKGWKATTKNNACK